MPEAQPPRLMCLLSCSHAQSPLKELCRRTVGCLGAYFGYVTQNMKLQASTTLACC